MRRLGTRYAQPREGVVKQDATVAATKAKLVEKVDVKVPVVDHNIQQPEMTTKNNTYTAVNTAAFALKPLGVVNKALGVGLPVADLPIPTRHGLVKVKQKTIHNWRTDERKVMVKVEVCSLFGNCEYIALTGIRLGCR